ncbi:hypothetical protein AB1Y20_007079 [Prymnesium parvum]|uniref:Uncharacterized protein n=1 Tax=Prymnesium parvum TaxID=97485 RepID=A0AB34IZE9_PRYPA
MVATDPPAHPVGGGGGVGARRMGLVGKRMATLATRGVVVTAADMVEAEVCAGTRHLRIPGAAGRADDGARAAMPPPAPKQVSTRAMAGALGLLGPLSGSEARDEWVAR